MPNIFRKVSQVIISLEKWTKCPKDRKSGPYREPMSPNPGNKVKMYEKQHWGPNKKLLKKFCDTLHRLYHTIFYKL